jgi:cytochrome c biogenesis protein CcmG, thiol:disulfide interchange protein DsbE
VGALTLGPFVLSLERAYAAFGFALLLIAAEVWARRRREPEVSAWAFTTVWVVFVFARIGFVATNWNAFAAAPWTIFAFWQGGFAPWWGIAAGAIGSAFGAARGGALRRAAPTIGLAALLAWLLPSGLLGAAPGAAEATLPTESLTALAGGSVTLARVGEPQIINVWATWCPPCRRELPLLFAAAEANSDVRIWLVNQRESAAVVDAYLRAEGFGRAGVLLDVAGVVGGHFQVAGLPTTLAFDRSGGLVDLHVGELSAVTLERLLSAAAAR